MPKKRTFDNYFDFAEAYQAHDGCSAVMLLSFGIVVVSCFSAAFFSTTFRFEEDTARILAILPAIGLLLVALTITARFRGRGSTFQCHNCHGKLKGDSSEHAFKHNRCLHCGEQAFPVPADIGWFVSVDPSEIRKKPDEAASSRVAKENENPYASPSATDDRESPGVLNIFAVLFSTFWKSVCGVTASDKWIIDQVNGELREAGVEELNTNYERSTILSYRRTSALWLILCVPPFVLSSIFLLTSLRLESWTEIVLLVLPFASVLIGSILFGLITGVGPRWWTRWWHGNPPPLMAETEEETGFRGIRLVFYGNLATTSNRPHVNIRFRVNSPTEFVVGLLNKETLVEFRTKAACQANTWVDHKVNFATLLQAMDSDFAGNEIRLIPPEDVELEIDSITLLETRQVEESKSR